MCQGQLHHKDESSSNALKAGTLTIKGASTPAWHQQEEHDNICLQQQLLQLLQWRRVEQARPHFCGGQGVERE
jgi:hypothetical protein